MSIARQAATPGITKSMMQCNAIDALFRKHSTRFWDTVAFRLALGYGLLAIGSVSVIAAAFYFGTVGVLARSTDAKLISISQRLADHYETRGGEPLRPEGQQPLGDGIDADSGG